MPPPHPTHAHAHACRASYSGLPPAYEVGAADTSRDLNGPSASRSGNKSMHRDSSISAAAQGSVIAEPRFMMNTVAREQKGNASSVPSSSVNLRPSSSSSHLQGVPGGVGVGLRSISTQYNSLKGSPGSSKAGSPSGSFRTQKSSDLSSSPAVSGRSGGGPDTWPANSSTRDYVGSGSSPTNREGPPTMYGSFPQMKPRAMPGSDLQPSSLTSSPNHSSKALSRFSSTSEPAAAAAATASLSRLAAPASVRRRTGGAVSSPLLDTSATELDVDKGGGPPSPSAYRRDVGQLKSSPGAVQAVQAVLAATSAPASPVRFRVRWGWRQDLGLGA